MKKAEFIEKYGEEAYKKHLEMNKQYYQDNKEQIAEYNKQYKQDNKEKLDEYNKQYRQEHKEEITEYSKKYYQEHKEQIAEYHKQYQKQYNQTPKGRAINLYSTYMTADRNANREFTTPPITTSYIVDRIFTSTCTYCGESDWTKLGCDRIDNNLPHQEGNVVCCCGKCNIEKHTLSMEDYLEKRAYS